MSTKDTLIVICSGTGYTHKALSFLEHEYQLDHEDVDYDLLAIPGSIHSLALMLFSMRPIRTALEYWIRFLVQHHALHRVVILDHEGCAWFQNIMKEDRRCAKKEQHQVIGDAILTLAGSLPTQVTYELWQASLIDGQPVFNGTVAKRCFSKFAC